MGKPLLAGAEPSVTVSQITTSGGIRQLLLEQSWVKYYHRLKGSSSHVLTATPHSYGKGQNSTPYKIKTPERIGMKFGTVDYVLDISPQNKFGNDRSSGGFWVNM